MTTNPTTEQATYFNYNPAECTIMVVDDNSIVVELVTALLEMQQYHVETFDSGADALAWLRSNQPDLIITDLMMPDMDGFDFIAQIRQSYQRFIPIIMFTASNNENDRIKALTNGADDFLTKPVNRYELQARVHNLLRLKKSQDYLTGELVDRNRLLREVTNRYLELEASTEDGFTQQPVETMLATIKAIYRQLQQPIERASAYLELASRNYISPGRELDLAKGELDRITRTLQGLEEVAKSGNLG
ncbi:MAG TPA: response regulator [Chloroflexia bacterium]|nr:response regulator [Chloroflexia bacterium]